MFRTWIVRQRNLVHKRKLTDIVISLDSELVSCPKSYSMRYLYLKPFNDIIFGINGSMRVQKVVDIDLLQVHEERIQLTAMNKKDKRHYFSSNIWTQMI